MTNLNGSSGESPGENPTSVDAIRLLLVDEQRVLREPLAILLSGEPDLQVVAQAGSEDEVRSLLASGELIDIAIVEVEMSDGQGIRVIRDLCAHDADIRILVLTSSANKRIYGRALYVGASGIVCKTADPVELITSIRKLADCEPLMPITEAAYLMAQGEQFQQEDEIVHAALA
jgi:DNA-binding NarL/FixJ family response regulator